MADPKLMYDSPLYHARRRVYTGGPYQDARQSQGVLNKAASTAAKRDLAESMIKSGRDLMKEVYVEEAREAALVAEYGPRTRKG